MSPLTLMLTVFGLTALRSNFDDIIIYAVKLVEQPSKSEMIDGQTGLLFGQKHIYYLNKLFINFVYKMKRNHKHDGINLGLQCLQMCEQ